MKKENRKRAITSPRYRKNNFKRTEFEFITRKRHPKWIFTTSLYGGLACRPGTSAGHPPGALIQSHTDLTLRSIT